MILNRRGVSPFSDMKICWKNRTQEFCLIDVRFPSTTFVLMSREPKWVGWARELQAIAQTGLHFTESEYDRKRYKKILAISIEIFANSSGESPEFVKGLFDLQ